MEKEIQIAYINFQKKDKNNVVIKTSQDEWFSKKFAHHGDAETFIKHYKEGDVITVDYIVESGRNILTRVVLNNKKEVQVEEVTEPCLYDHIEKYLGIIAEIDIQVRNQFDGYTDQTKALYAATIFGKVVEELDK